MRRDTRKITIPALFSALCVVTLYIASIWPAGMFGLVAFASVFVAAAVIEIGLASGIYVFTVSSALGMLILPNRAAAILFVLFFGYYPVVKSIVERKLHVALQWVMKLAVFNASLTVIWFLLRGLFLGFGGRYPGAAVVYLGGSVVFAVYDYGYTKLIWFYLDRISKYKK